MVRASSSPRRVFVASSQPDLRRAVREALEKIGVLAQMTSESRVALKPNFTYPHHRPGVTTSPAVLRATVQVLRERTRHLAIVETDGGYGAWAATEAFTGHGVYALAEEFGVEIVNLCTEPRERIAFTSRGRQHVLPLPTRLLRDTTLLLSLPVPKIHAMTGLSLSYKNQWGCIPDTMRLRRHAIFDDAIIAINRALRPAVLMDGTTFLDRNGPMEGVPVRRDLLIAATDAGACDRYVAELMGFPWRRCSHLRRAAELGDLPADLQEIDCNVPPSHARTHTFRLARTPRNWIALAGFKSRFLTWLGYESWFGRVILHGILYLLVGRPVRPSSNSSPQPRGPSPAG